MRRRSRKTRPGPLTGRTLRFSYLNHRRLRFEPLEDRRLLAGIIVGNILDVVNGDTSSIGNLIADDGGDGIALREAVLAANGTAGADVITFDSALGGLKILLGGTELAITEALTIDGRPLAANVTIDANQLSRFFNITATTGQMTFGGLTLIDGKTTSDGSAGRGGAIRSLTTGLLTLDQTIVSGSSTTGMDADGGAISAVGDVMLVESTISGNSTAGSTSSGGGIRAGGNVTLTQSAVGGNSTSGNGSSGGGISAAGNVTLTRSTVSGNKTQGDTSSGGGIWADGDVTLNQSTVSGNFTFETRSGGGIWADGDVTLTLSTVSGNRVLGASFMGLAYGGGIWVNGAVTITQSTVTQNGAFNNAQVAGQGVFQNDSASNFPISISGSIVAGNPLSVLNEFVKDPDSTLTANYSVIGTGITPDAGENNVSTNSPGLGPLANHGGPTQTHATLDTSPAINAGNPSIGAAAFDQRGAPFVRVSGGRIDAGAYERQSVSGLSLVVDTTDDIYDFDYSAGHLSLREAVALANGMAGADTITFSPALSGATIRLSGTEIESSEALTIDAGALAESLTIDAQESSRIFNISTPTGNSTLVGLTLIHGRPIGPEQAVTLSPPGGGIFASGGGGSNLTIMNTTVSGNTATGEGGGIFAVGFNLTLTNSTVSGNSTTGLNGRGGGIAVAYGNLTLTNSTVSGNSTSGNFADGGGINAHYDVTLTNSTISGNSTAGEGGGILAGGDLTLTNSTVTGNGATGEGGGISADHISADQMEVSHSIIADNTADGGGPDLAGSLSLLQYSLIGDGSGILDESQTPDESGNLIGGPNLGPIDPLLGPLADNGGPTLTHALLPGSPAIDAGDPNAMPGENDVPAFDQRGTTFLRVIGNAIDMGAFERQTPELFGDYNQNGEVEAADYVVWRKTLGTTGVTAFSGADGDGDTTIDQDDYGVWRAHFGNMLPAAGAENGTSVEPEVVSRSDVGSGQPQEPVVMSISGQASSGTQNLRPVAAGFAQLSTSKGDSTRRPLRTPASTGRPAFVGVLANSRDDALVAWLANRDGRAPMAVDMERGFDWDSLSEHRSGDICVTSLDAALELIGD